ncbi:DUF1453 domain-containing protein [Actinomadura atramentaria]|uniref:DUF1453 domain-containing protein n=1 Tax=Actinomadura atramentaria TaxID=1990 RepID=UPI0012FAA8A0|nr:DUF1453 domain-containing protein [Actinomadura atramentaria]
MNTVGNVLLALVAVVLVLRRQLAVRPIDERSAFTLPLVLGVIGLVSGGLVDRAHPAVSGGLLAAGLAVAVGSGVVRAFTVRVWLDDAGAPWRRGTAWTVVTWLVTVALRAGLIAVGYASGLHEGGGVLLFLAVSLIVQGLLVGYRARNLRAGARPGLAG